MTLTGFLRSTYYKKFTGETVIDATPFRQFDIKASELLSHIVMAQKAESLKDLPNKRVKAMQKIFEASEKRNDDLEKRFEASKKRNDDLEKRFGASKKRNDDLEKRFEASEKRFEASEKRNDDLSREIEKMKEELKALKLERKKRSGRFHNEDC